MAALCNRAGHIYFHPVVSSSFFLFFPRLISVVGDWVSTILPQMVWPQELGPLAAEVVSLVWGTPANFNGFRILVALLHGTLVVGVSQTLCIAQRAPPVFGRAAITLGIGPHF